MINQFSNLNLHYHMIRVVLDHNKFIEENGTYNHEVYNTFGISDVCVEIVMKGSRYAGKTFAAIDVILEDMLENKEYSAYVIMNTQKDHFGKTLKAFDSAVDRLEKKIPNSSKLIRKISDKALLRVEINWPNGHTQEIKFISLEEAHTAGDTPPPNTFFKYIWCEELTSSNEKGKDQFEEKEALLEGIDTLKKTIVRFVPDNEDIITIFTFNPYNKGEPLLEDHNKYLLDNKRTLIEYGWQSRYLKHNQKLLITSNYHQNIFLQKKAWKNADKDRLLNPLAYDITGLGISGSPMKYQYSHIRHIVDKFESYETEWKDFNIVRCGVDVGESQAKTAYVLFGWDKKIQAFTIKEVHTYKPNKNLLNHQNHSKNIIDFFNKIVKIKYENYNSENNNLIELKGYIDGAAGEFIDLFHTIKPKWTKENSLSLNFINLKAFPEDTKKAKEWRIEERVIRWERLLTTGKLVITPKNSPMLYEELMNQPLDALGKRDKKYDHSTNASEMAMGDFFIRMKKNKIKKRGK